MTIYELQALVASAASPPRYLYVEDPVLAPTTIYKLNEKYGHVIFGPLLSSLKAEVRDFIVAEAAEVLEHGAQIEERVEKFGRYWKPPVVDIKPPMQFQLTQPASSKWRAW